MHDSFIVLHGWESFPQEQMDKAFEEVMGTKCRVDLKYNSIQKRQEREGGPSPLGKVPLKELQRRSHSVYEGLLAEHRLLERMEEKRRMQSFRNSGIDPFEDDCATIDRILNDDEPDESSPFSQPVFG